jgi:hypothetical protein
MAYYLSPLPLKLTREKKPIMFATYIGRREPQEVLMTQFLSSLVPPAQRKAGPHGAVTRAKSTK